MSFEKAIAIYLDWKNTHARFAPNRYETRLTQFADYIGRTTLLNSITGDNVVQFHREMQKAVYQKGKLQKEYSPATVAYSCRVLKNFFMFWQGRGESKVNHKEIRTTRYVHPNKRIVTLEDFKKMSASLDERYFDDLLKKLVVHLLWDTGMRVSELCDLNLSEIGNVDPEYGVRTAVIRTRKTMKYNLVVWSKDTDDLLTRYLGIRLCTDAPTDALFIGRKRVEGSRITTRTIERWIEYIVKTANVDSRITVHSFRHGKGHHILNNGGNIRDVAAVLRHANPESSLNYLRLNHKQFLSMASKYLHGVSEEKSAVSTVQYCVPALSPIQ